GLGVMGAQSASGATQDEPTSTPVPISTPDGQISSYVINTKANPGQVRKVEKAVRSVDGTVIQSWPEIGVVVAHSTSADFRNSVVAAAENAVDAVRPTSSVDMSEVTSDGSHSLRGTCKGQQQAVTKKRDYSVLTTAAV